MLLGIPGEGQRVVAVAPHADDELYGCGGYLLRALAAGADVGLVLVTLPDGLDGEARAKRRAEFDRCNAALATLPPAVLGYEDGALDLVGQADLQRKLDDALDTLRPTVLLVPSATHHQDHVAVHRACVASLRVSRPWHPASAWCYETGPSPCVGYGSGAHLIPRWYIDVSCVMSRKLSLLESCYPSQMSVDAWGVDRLRGAERLAAARGADCGVAYAEAYEPLWGVVRCRP